VTSINSQLIQF